MISKKKVAPSKTALFAASILDTICDLDSNKITNSQHHRIRELIVKLKKSKSLRIKPTNSKKYLEGAIKKHLEVRQISKEIEELSIKIGKLHDKFILPDIKNAMHLAKAAGKSALESIKVNKKALSNIKNLITN